MQKVLVDIACCFFSLPSAWAIGWLTAGSLASQSACSWKRRRLLLEGGTRSPSTHSRERGPESSLSAAIFLKKTQGLHGLHGFPLFQKGILHLISSPLMDYDKILWLLPLKGTEKKEENVLDVITLWTFSAFFPLLGIIFVLSQATWHTQIILVFSFWNTCK